MLRFLSVLGLGLGLAVAPRAQSQTPQTNFDGAYAVKVHGHQATEGTVFINGDFAFILLGSSLGAIFSVETVGMTLNFSPLIQTARVHNSEVSGNMVAMGSRSFVVALSGTLSGDTLSLTGTGLIRADFKGDPNNKRRSSRDGEDVFPTTLRMQGDRNTRWEWRDVWQKSYEFDNVQGGLAVQPRDPQNPNDASGTLTVCGAPLRLQSLFGGMAILRRTVGNLTTGTGEDIEKTIEGVLVNTHYNAAFLGTSRYYLYRLYLSVNGVGWFRVDTLLED